MKVLVVSNCAMPAYVQGLRALFPEWDIKGVLITMALEWLQNKSNDLFLDWLKDVDYYIGLDDDNLFSQLPTNERMTRIYIPSFLFSGYHPDSFHLHAGVKSVLKAGNLHSRIAVTAFVMGLPLNKAVKLFNGDIYQKLGYFDSFERERVSLIDRFKYHGISIAADFDSWYSRGNFLYTYNHPKHYVLFDILRRALQGRLMTDSEVEAAASKSDVVSDFLSESIIWPIYPEIGKPHGINDQCLWRTGRNKGFEYLTLDEFVQRTYDSLSQLDTLKSADVPEFDACADVLAQCC